MGKGKAASQNTCAQMVSEAGQVGVRNPVLKRCHFAAKPDNGGLCGVHGARAAHQAARHCGCGRAGIRLNSETLGIARCEDCGLVADDLEAAKVVDALLVLLGTQHKRSDGTVAEAIEQLKRKVR